MEIPATSLRASFHIVTPRRFITYCGEGRSQASPLPGPEGQRAGAARVTIGPFTNLLPLTDAPSGFDLPGRNPV